MRKRFIKKIKIVFFLITMSVKIRGISVKSSQKREIIKNICKAKLFFTSFLFMIKILSVRHFQKNVTYEKQVCCFCFD